MAADKKLDEDSYPQELQVTLDLSQPPEHNEFTRHLTFQNADGLYLRQPVAFRKTGPLRWEWKNEQPNEIEVLRSLAEQGNRSYWDRMYLENRGGDTALAIEHLKIVIRYNNPAGDSPVGIDHGKIPIVDWRIQQTLQAGQDMIGLSTYAQYSRFAWAGVTDNHPQVVRWAAEDLGKSGSDAYGDDHYGDNPKYGAGLKSLCAKFVSWYYYQAGITVNGMSLEDFVKTQEFHDVFKAQGTLYRYSSGTNLQAFVHAETGAEYIPRPGDFLERRKQGDSPPHSMLILRWIPGDPGSTDMEKKNRAVVINGPWPVTLRLVKIHKEEVEEGRDYCLGRID